MHMGMMRTMKKRSPTIGDVARLAGVSPTTVSFVLIAAHLRPALSTVALPHCEMGRWAVDQLIEQAEHGSAALTRHAIICPYVERESV
jgi:LacI family transcriptional regulator